MSADMELHARKTAEAKLHDSDYMDGELLDIGDGYSVAFHSHTCRYCSRMTWRLLQSRTPLPTDKPN